MWLLPFYFSFIGTYYLPQQGMSVHIQQKYNILEVRSDAPWDRGWTIHKMDNSTLRMEAVFIGGEIQPLYGNIIGEKIEWSDGNTWFRCSYKTYFDVKKCNV